MTTDSPASTHATVITDRPDRYGKQLASHLGRLEDVVASRLVRFGEKDELSVVWQRDNG
ncbi:MAG TPA: hypothetical protein VFC01_08735 [Mycobacterium sp.]|nr:hypothetical protein [Mycobacterium sp.]